MYNRCKHTLAIHVGINYDSFNLYPLLKSFNVTNEVEQDGVTVEDVQLVKSGLSGWRNEAYYVYAAQTPQIVYRNNDGCITCRLCKQSVTCPHRTRLMEVLNITYEEYKEDRAQIIIESSDREFIINQPHSFTKCPVPKPHRIETDPYPYDDDKYDSGKFNDAIFAPEISNCSNCNHSFTNIEYYNIIEHQSILFALENPYQCRVHYYQCKYCFHANKFDGYNQHI